MDSRWGKELASTVRANKATFDKAAELIDKQIQSQRSMLEDSRDMGKPDWAIRAAEKVGYLNALKFLRALYTVTDKSE